MAKREKTEFLCVHCSSTTPDQDIGVREIDEYHRSLGWACCGYHYVIRRNGSLENGRPEDDVAAHVKNFNNCSIGICLVGGLNRDGRTSEFNFSRIQMATLESLLIRLQTDYPGAKILGHRDLSPDADHDGIVEPNEWSKQCPSFSVQDWWI